MDKGNNLIQKQTEFNELIDQLNKDLSLSGFSEYRLQQGTRNQFIEYLSQFLLSQIRYNAEKLRQLLYRVDVSEENLILVFQESGSDETLCNKLAGLIIEREFIKIKLRKEYKS